MNTKIHNKFLLGANYWTRNQGLAMWRDWHPEEIDQELKEIHDCGLNVIRMFVVWNDFQPIKEYYKGTFSNKVPDKVCLRHDENQSIENNPHLIDYTMVAKFDQFLKIAQKYELKVIPVLIVGFMGGVSFDVDFRNGRSIYTDPTMLYYQELYFGFFAKRYHENNTILVWEFGNEVGYYQQVSTPAELRLWMKILVTAIREHDQNHPIASGEQGLVDVSRYAEGGLWYHNVNVEMCDVTTVHVYPVFMPEIGDGILSLKSTYCSAWRSRLAAGQYNRPVLTEEVSTVGTSLMKDGTSANWLRTTLFSLLGNGDSGMLWWTNSDMKCHDKLPYCLSSTNASEHGGISLLDVDGKPKLQADEYKKFSRLMQKVDFPALNKAPAKIAIVHSASTELNDKRKRKISLLAFTLAKMSGQEVDVINSEANFDNYKLLICPSYDGVSPIFYKDQRRIDQFVKDGGCAYLSMENGCWERFETMFGVKINEKTANTESLSLIFKNIADKTSELSIQPQWKTDVMLDSAEVIAEDVAGNPAVIMNKHGKGKAFFSFYNLEEHIVDNFNCEQNINTLGGFYRELKKHANISSIATSNSFYLEICDCDKYLVLINHDKNVFDDVLILNEAIMSLKDVASGEIFDIENNTLTIRVAAFDGKIMEII